MGLCALRARQLLYGGRPVLAGPFPYLIPAFRNVMKDVSSGYEPLDWR